METISYDAVVVGAGAAGLLGALEIALTGRSVAVLEAKDRAGGRMHTMLENGLAVELGAEFVHGNLPITKQLLQKAGAKQVPVNGSIWQHKNGKIGEQHDFISDYDALEKKFREVKEDKPVAQFLAENLQGAKDEDLRFSLKNYVEGYYAADTNKASTLALCEELTKGEEEQFRVEGGYRLLVTYLEEQCRAHGVTFFFSEPVLQLHWKENEVTAFTEKGSYKSRKVLITVPVGVLQKEAITFFPALPEITKAVQQLGFGHVLKLVLQFEDAFWKEKSVNGGNDLSDLNFLFSAEAVPTWWTHHPKTDNVLVGWLGGPRAAAMQFLTKEEVVQKGIHALSKIFSLDVLHLQQKLQAAHWYNWSADPFSCGAYSYEVVGGNEAIRVMQEPVAGSIFFAGEGLHPGPEIGTVEGALASGRETAHRLIAAFAG